MTRWKNIRHTHRPSTKLVHRMFDAIAIGAVPYNAPPRHTAPMLAPFIAVDAAETSRGYRIGLSTRKGTARTVVKKPGSQQKGELAGVSYAAHFALNQRIHSVDLLIDKMAAIFSSRKLKASPKAPARTRLVRNQFNHLWCTGTMQHPFWVLTRVMPADRVSRIHQVSSDLLGKAMVEARSKWNSIMNNLQLIQPKSRQVQARQPKAWKGGKAPPPPPPLVVSISCATTAALQPQRHSVLGLLPAPCLASFPFPSLRSLIQATLSRQQQLRFQNSVPTSHPQPHSLP